MQNLAIYVSEISSLSSGPKFKEPIYNKAYPQLFSFIYQYGVKPIIIHNQDKTYLGGGKFSEYWTPRFNENFEILKYDYHNENVKVDLIYDKARFEATDVKMINNIVIRNICKDKYLSYILFPEFHPESMLLTCDVQLQTYILNMKNKMIVLKELDSNGGKAVYIGRALGYQKNLSFPLLAQSFIETIGGYEGKSGRHDLRIVIFDGHIVQGRLRKPTKNGYISNIVHGGENRVIQLDEIPIDAINVMKRIDTKISRIFGIEHRFYSADFGFDGSEWRLFELNAWPGLVDCDAGDAEQESMKNIAFRLVNCLD